MRLVGNMSVMQHILIISLYLPLQTLVSNASFWLRKERKDFAASDAI